MAFQFRIVSKSEQYQFILLGQPQIIKLNKRTYAVNT